MKTKEEVRTYNVADATLKQKADLILSNVDRDMADFSTRGVTPATITDFQALIDVFDSTPADSEYLGPQTVATALKDALVEELKTEIRTVRSMAEIRYKGVGNYTTFGFKDMSEMSDADLVKLGKKVVRVGTTLLSELTSRGLTAAILAGITTKAIALDEAIDAQAIAIEARDIATQLRIQRGNALHAEMIILCMIGKSLYMETNEALYNDYLSGDQIAADPDEPEAIP